MPRGVIITASFFKEDNHPGCQTLKGMAAPEDEFKVCMQSPSRSYQSELISVLRGASKTQRLLYIKVSALLDFPASAPRLLLPLSRLLPCIASTHHDTTCPRKCGGFSGVCPPSRVRQIPPDTSSCKTIAKFDLGCILFSDKC